MEGSTSLVCFATFEFQITSYSTEKYTYLPSQGEISEGLETGLIAHFSFLNTLILAYLQGGGGGGALAQF